MSRQPARPATRPAARPAARLPLRVFLLGGLIVALLVAGVGSYYASAHPDGLEYVAEQTGFIDSAEESATADSPFADYATKGVDNPRLGGGLAGVLGCLVVLLLTSGVAYAVRRRRTPASTASTASTGTGSDAA